MSPKSIIVAVPVSPFQHSPTFGHMASSHTVAILYSELSKVSFKNSKRSPLGALCLSHGGFFKPGGKPGIVAVAVVPPLEVVSRSNDPSKVATGPHMAAAALNFGAGAGGSTPFSFADSNEFLKSVYVL